MPVTVTAHAIADRARRLAGVMGAGTTEGRRSLPIRRPGEAIRGVWDDPGSRAVVLAGIEVRDASLEVGGDAGEWGTTATVRLHVVSPLPRVAAQALAGKAVRRLKALAETGEAPTTERNPSARAAGGAR